MVNKYHSIQNKETIKNGLMNVGAKPWVSKQDRTKIAWTDTTFNIAWGCQKVSDGCKNCYADHQSSGWPQGFGKNGKPALWGPGCESAKGMGWEVEQNRRILSEANWKKPKAWNKQAIKNQSIMLTFSSSMADNFEDHPVIKRELKRLWKIIRATPSIHWQLCTKRAERILESLPDDWFEFENGYQNVWLGVSVESEKYAYRFNDYLATIPAAVRFVSFEPALGPVHDAINFENLDWCIVGGESGKNRRPFDQQWARDMQTKCKESDVAFFYKQDTAFRSSTNPYLDGKKHYDFPLLRKTKMRHMK